MTVQKNYKPIFFFNILIFFVLIMLYSSSAFSIKVFNARPMLPLSMLIALSMFCSESTAAFSGLAIGIFIDSASSTPFGFNSIVFMMFGFFTALISHYLFNKNIRSCITLCLICSIAYFSLKWFFFSFFEISFKESADHLLSCQLPSALFTTICVIPLYYLERFLYRSVKTDI